MKNTINIGDRVEYVGADSNPAVGRKGTVLEISDLTPTETNPLFKRFRFRVHWTEEWGGHPIRKGGADMKNGVRTWVKQDSLKLI